MSHGAFYGELGVPVSARAAFEAWEADAFSGLTDIPGDWDPGVGCAVWRCLVNARTLVDVAECEEIHGPCESGRRWCEDGVLHDCGTGRDRAISCADLGASCVTDHCELGACYITPHGNVDDALSCIDGDVTLCRGALWTGCDVESPGASCDYLLIGDVLPLVACRPPGVWATSPAATPITCDADVLSFTSVYGGSYTYDCLANGFAGCDEWSCTFAE